jgi:TonB family protein
MEEDKQRRELEFSQKLKLEELENKKRLAEEQKALETERVRIAAQQKQVEDSLKLVQQNALKDIEAERKRFREEQVASAKLEAARLETERAGLLARQKSVEDSLKQVEAANRKNLEAEKQKALAAVQAEAQAEKTRIEAERQALFGRQKALEDSLNRAAQSGRASLEKGLADERRRLDDERKRLQEERAAFEEEKRKWREAHATATELPETPAPGPSATPTPAAPVDSAFTNNFGEFVKSVDGQLTGPKRSFDDVNMALSPVVSDLMGIYFKIQRKSPDLQGQIVLSFVIKSSGEVQNVKIMSNTLNNAKIEASAVAAVSKSRFASLGEGGRAMLVTYPIVFMPR